MRGDAHDICGGTGRLRMEWVTRFRPRGGQLPSRLLKNPGIGLFS